MKPPGRHVTLEADGTRLVAVTRGGRMVWEARLPPGARAEKVIITHGRVIVFPDMLAFDAVSGKALGKVR